MEVTTHLQGWPEVLQLLVHDVAERRSQMCWIEWKVRGTGPVEVAILDIVLVVAVLFGAHHEHHLHRVLGGLGEDVWRPMQRCQHFSCVWPRNERSRRANRSTLRANLLSAS